VTVSIINAMNDPEAFQPWFNGESWDAWRAVLKAAFALPMTEAELRIFAKLAGGRSPPRRRVRQLVAISGRRSGKDSIASLLAANAAAVEQAHIGRLRPGETAHVLLLACDRDQSRIVEGYTRSYFREIDDLSRMVTRETRLGIELSNRVNISIQTNSYRQARGRSVLLAVLDECAFYRSEDESASSDVELHRALMPSLMTLPGSMAVLISTPYKKSGLLYQMWRDFYAKDSDTVLVIQASSLQLNPTLDPAMIQAEREADPEAAKAEWDGQFRSDISSYVSIELIESAVDRGVYVRAPRPDALYVGFVDAATGVGTDSFAAGIAHKEGELIVLDVAYERPPPFSPAAAVAEVAALFAAYGITQATGDKFGAGFTIEMFQAHGIEYVYSELDRSQIYISMLPLLSSGRARLLDSKKLVTQFASLERKTSAIGRDVVNHPAGERNHDDLCNAVAGALSLCATTGDDTVREFIRAWHSDDAVNEYDRHLAEQRRVLN
jgi:hypothetical protein